MMRLCFKYLIYLVVLSSSFSTRADAYDDFFIAVVRDDAGSVKRLLAKGMDPNSRDPKGVPALSLALRRESPRVFEALLAHPAIDVNALNAAGESALMLAALAGDVEACRRLLARGANLEQPGWTAMHYAASSTSTEVVRLLLAKGASVDPQAPNGTTPLMLAAQYAPEATIDLLLERGADPHMRNRRGLQPIDFAELGGRDFLVERFQRLPR